MSSAICPPGPKGKPFVGSFFELRRDPLKFFLKLGEDYGEIASFKVGPQRIFLLNHPEYIGDVLVTHQHNFMKGRALQVAKRFLGEGLLTSEGEHHRRQRRLAQPAFHRQRIIGYGAVMTDYAARTRERWQNGATVDIAEEMNRLTLAIVGKTLFDADVEAESREIGEALTTILSLFNRVMLPYTGLLQKFPLPANLRFQQAAERLDATIFRMIQEHRTSGIDRGDLLSMLLAAQDEEGDGGGMTDKQVRDEAMTIFLAGHETTANALAWTWYLLSQNPAVETKLHAELDAVLLNRLPTFHDLPRLPYTEMVLAESMRLFPPAWVIGRRALADQPLGPYTIRAGSIVICSQYVTHRNPLYFPEPLRFDPERWTPEAKTRLPKFAYFPFGGGGRVCIGESFAWMEGILLLATIAQHWRMRLVPGHPVEPQPRITLRPKHGLRMTLERRG